MTYTEVFKRANIKMFDIGDGNHSEMKFADMDLRLAVVLFTAVVCFSSNAGMSCLNSLFSVILIFNLTPDKKFPWWRLKKKFIIGSFFYFHFIIFYIYTLSWCSTEGGEEHAVHTA